MIDKFPFFKELYQNFNERRIEDVISQMSIDVKWANGMEGGFVHGHDGVRAYWTRQFALVSSRVTPMELSEENGLLKIKVHQVVHDLDGRLLADEMVFHFFRLRDDKIAEFVIGEKGK
jgi:predicted SnoaL-like aldol condensation-catalyzing enzyme